MRLNRAKILAARTDLHLDPAHVAAFVGTTTAGYRDIEWFDDEIQTVDVAKFMRLCAALRLSPNEVLEFDPEPGRRTPEDLGTLENEFGQLRLADYFRTLLPEIEASHEPARDAIEYVSESLENEEKFCEMDVSLVGELCALVNVDLIAVLNQCFNAAFAR